MLTAGLCYKSSCSACKIPKSSQPRGYSLGCFSWTFVYNTDASINIYLSTPLLARHDFLPITWEHHCGNSRFSFLGSKGLEKPCI